MGILDDFRRQTAIREPPAGALDGDIVETPTCTLDGWCLVRLSGTPPGLDSYHLLGLLDGDRYLSGSLVAWDAERYRAMGPDGTVYDISTPAGIPSDDLVEHWWGTAVQWVYGEEMRDNGEVFMPELDL